MVYLSKYENDGSGRDTYVNHADAHWMNPLPAGTFMKSTSMVDRAMSSTAGKTFYPADTIDPLASRRPPGRVLYGQSRYGTTVLRSMRGEPGRGDEDGGGEMQDGSGTAEGSSPSTFDPEQTALDKITDDVPNPERRLRQPGHANTGLDPTGGSTFNGIKDPWAAPRQVDNTLLRIAPTYESTCHYGLRTGRFYNEDEAPSHENTLPEKGVNWGKSRYYP